MRKKIEILVYYFQITILLISYYIFKFLNFQKCLNSSWVIGVSEIANNISNLKNTLNPSVSVALDKNIYYNSTYDYSINITNKYFNFIIRIFYGPLLLGYLVNKNSHFLYIWYTGFLLDREYEFEFLKSKNKKIVCMFVGDDIRSIKLSLAFTKKLNIDNFVEYVGSQSSYYLTEKYDNDKKKIAQIADKYSDLVFNFKLDQISYLEKKQFPWAYMYDKNKFFKNDNKFENIKKIKILHAPSNPFVKGTPLVRASIKKLELEGYQFDYVELQKMPNEVVLEHLRTSHIVLNQFYGYDISLGLFAIEAMANHTALMMSYDPSAIKHYDIELEGLDNCLFNTKYWEVYDNLKYLLDNPEKIKYYADRGYDFAYKHYTYEAASEYINKVLKENGVIE